MINSKPIVTLGIAALTGGLISLGLGSRGNGQGSVEPHGVSITADDLLKTFGGHATNLTLGRNLPPGSGLGLAFGVRKADGSITSLAGYISDVKAGEIKCIILKDMADSNSWRAAVIGKSFSWHASLRGLPESGGSRAADSSTPLLKEGDFSIIKRFHGVPTGGSSGDPKELPEGTGYDLVVYLVPLKS